MKWNRKLSRSLVAALGISWGGSLLSNPVAAQPVPPRGVPVQPQPAPFRSPSPPPVSTSPSVSIRIEFGRRTHAERLTNQLVADANALCLQMDRNYKGNSNYNQRYREMYGLLQDAIQVRDQIRSGAHRGQRQENDRIAMALHKMDRELHGAERDLRGWRVTSGVRNATRLDSLVAQLESTLHSMMEDYGERSRISGANSYAPIPASPPPRR